VKQNAASYAAKLAGDPDQLWRSTWLKNGSTLL
jgi:hypothetical protein